MNSEKNTCAFCRNITEVNRQYLHAKNTPKVGDGFDFIYYCNECGLLENVTKLENKSMNKKLRTESEVEEEFYRFAFNEGSLTKTQADLYLNFIHQIRKDDREYHENIIKELK